MTQKTNKDFPTLEKIDFVTGLRVLNYIERNSGLGWTDFDKGHNLAYSGFYAAAIRLARDREIEKLKMPEPRQLLHLIDSSTDNKSHAFFLTDKRVAPLREVIQEKYAKNNVTDEVTRGAFAVYRMQRVSFGEEEFSSKDIERLLADIPEEVLLRRLSDLSKLAKDGGLR